jgi:hypothetical protein
MRNDILRKGLILGILLLFVTVGIVSGLNANPFSHSTLARSDYNFQYTWSVETVDSIGEVGHYTDIAVTSDNTVFISYYDIGNKDLKCACLINNEWSITVVDSEGDVGRYTSLALDSLGHPHISYYDTTLHALKHAYFDGIEWHKEVVDSSGNVGLDTSIAIDSTNHIFISYYDETNGDLKCAKSVDNGWDIQVVDSTGDTGELSSIALDVNGNPHISYTNRYDFHLYHAYYSGDTWVIETVDDTSILYGSISITYDPDGFVHILYYDVTPDHFSLKHAYQSHDGWHIEIIDPYLWNWFTESGADIAFDQLGRIHIVYFNWLNETVNYAWKVNGIWNFEFIEPSFEDTGVRKGPFTALALDPQGIPHVSYYDANNIDLKYARKIEYSPGVPTPPSGSSRGKPGKSYTFTTTSQDWDNDKIQYGWDWNGDYQVDQWTGFFNSGETCEISHTWNESGSFKIRVIAMDEKGFLNGYHLDENGEFSYWSDSLPITMPYSYNKPILRFSEWLFERFPNAFTLLRQLLGY